MKPTAVDEDEIEDDEEENKLINEVRGTRVCSGLV
jgi:hypothetical protein